MDIIIFFNIAWMNYYQGDLINNPPVSTHKFIQNQRWGGEILNFKPFNDQMYGYVEAGFRKIPKYVHYTIHIEELGATINQQSIGGVTVVWVASHRDRLGTVVIGWYRNARLYRKVHHRRHVPAGLL